MNDRGGEGDRDRAGNENKYKRTYTIQRSGMATVTRAASLSLSLLSFAVSFCRRNTGKQRRGNGSGGSASKTATPADERKTGQRDDTFHRKLPHGSRDISLGASPIRRHSFSFALPFTEEEQRTEVPADVSSAQESLGLPRREPRKGRQKKTHTNTAELYSSCLPTSSKTPRPRVAAQNRRRGVQLHLHGEHCPKSTLRRGTNTPCSEQSDYGKSSAAPIAYRCVAWGGAAVSKSISSLRSSNRSGGRSDQIRPVSFLRGCLFFAQSARLGMRRWPRFDSINLIMRPPSDLYQRQHGVGATTGLPASRFIPLRGPERPTPAR